MAGLAPEGSQFDACPFDAKMTEFAEDFFTSYEEVFDSFDAMGLGIVPVYQGLDVIQQAQSGIGKTATFYSGILQQLDYTPTTELAQQIEKVMWPLGDYLGVKVHACVGGTSVREDQCILQAGVHVVVGTRWRIKMFVLDEVVEMLSHGFKDQVCFMSLLLIPLVSCRFTYLLQSGLHALFAFILS
ncbi:hypothetical protein UlMin_000477 [Ulmus minor]